MKKDIHPKNYRLVAFKDMSNDHVFITRSAVNTKETIEIDGETYPVYKMEISNTSHPFYTGKMKLVDTAGRVDKFDEPLPETLRQEEQQTVVPLRVRMNFGRNHLGCARNRFGRGWKAAGAGKGSVMTCCD